MCVQSSRTLLKDNEFFKFNGKRIRDIYAVYENSRYATREEGGGYIADILYYNCHVHRHDCGNDYSGKSRGKSVLKVKELPVEFKDLFGMVENKGRKVFVTDFCTRERDSSNGSFTDETLDLNGWSSNSTSGNLGLYRGCEFLEKPENIFVIDEKSELGQKIANVLGKSFKVKEVEFADCGYKMEEGSLDFASKYPYAHTPIRIIDGLVYPDEKLPSWRWLQHGMPYRTPNSEIQKDFLGYPIKKNLRIWDDKLNAHVYVERVDNAEEGDEDLIRISFSSEHHDLYGYKGNAYCHITRYMSSNDYVKYAVTKIFKTEHSPVEYAEFRNGLKTGAKNRIEQGVFYRVNRIVRSDYKED